MVSGREFRLLRKHLSKYVSGKKLRLLRKLLSKTDEASDTVEKTIKTARLANKCDATKGLLWTSTKNKTGVENAFDHFKKHGKEFPEFPNATQYAQGARNFVTNPPKGTLTKVRPNGDKLFYDPATNTFAVQRADGALRTMFRPTDGISYWNKQ